MKLGMFQKEKSRRLIPDFILFTLLTMGLNLLAMLATCSISSNYHNKNICSSG